MSGGNLQTHRALQPNDHRGFNHIVRVGDIPIYINTIVLESVTARLP